VADDLEPAILCVSPVRNLGDTTSAEILFRAMKAEGSLHLGGMTETTYDNVCNRPDLIIELLTSVGQLSCR